MKSLFTPKEVLSVVDVSYRQLQYWDHSQFIGPTLRRGRRRTRMFTFKDIVLLETAVKLREHGFSVQRLRKVIDSLRQLLDDLPCALGQATLLFRGEEILLFSGQVTTNLDDDSYITVSLRSLRSRVDDKFPGEAAA